MIQQHRKFLVIIEDIAFILRHPVDIHLIGVIGAIGVIEVSSLSGPFLLQAVGHDKQVLDIVPANPERKRFLTVVDSVRNQPVDLDNMVDELCAGFLYKVDPVRTQLMQTVCWHMLWHGKDCSVIDPHCAVDVPEVSLNGSSDDAQMPDNTSSLIRFQPLENFHLGRFMLIFKYVPRNADQIGHLGDQLVGAILVYDFVFIGDSSTNSLLEFHVRLPLCFVVCSRKALVKASKFSKVFCAVFDGEGCPRNIMVSLCWRISQSSVNNADNPCIRKVANQSANTLFELDYHFRDAHIHQRIFRDRCFVLDNRIRNREWQPENHYIR